MIVRSGLCHGPDCREEITDQSPSDYFHNDGCQARWSAALVGTKADPMYQRPTFVPVVFHLGQRVTLTGAPDDGPREFVVTEATTRGDYTLTPVDPPKPVRLPWWKPNTWRRT